MLRTRWVGSLAAAALAVTSAVALPAPTGAAVRLCQGEVVTIEAQASGTTVVGTEGPDVIDGIGRHRLTILGLGGDDVICTGPGSDIVVRGGAGDDRIQSGDEQIQSLVARPVIHGDDGDDVILVGAGGGRFTGGPGDDRFTASGRAHDPHTVLPGPGDDTVVGTAWTQLVFGGTTGVRISVPEGVADGEGHDRFSGVRWFAGSPASDVFIGSSGNDTFRSQEAFPRASAAPDLVYGGAGDDHLLAVGTVHGGPGDDVVTLRGRGVAYGGPGDDEMSTPTGTLYGGPGDDELTMLLRGSAGPARVVGGAGSDTVRVSAGWCDGPCVGRVDGGGGVDRIQLRPRRVGAGVRIDLGRGRGAAQDTRIRLRRVENAVGSDGDDVLLGGPGPNVLQGREGDDVLRGRGGADLLRGGPGRDRADGGPGRDRCPGAEVRRSC